MTTANVSNATIKSFATGYNATNSVIDATSGAVAVTQAGAVEVVSIASNFFAGIRFAINERRGIKPVAPSDPSLAAQYAAQKAAKIEEMRKAIELFNRAHDEPTPEPVPAPKTRARRASV